MIEQLTNRDLEIRLRYVEKLLASADAQDLPTLTALLQKLFDEQVRRDLERKAAAPAAGGGFPCE